jgi:hypothetical protein
VLLAPCDSVGPQPLRLRRGVARPVGAPALTDLPRMPWQRMRFRVMVVALAAPMDRASIDLAALVDRRGDLVDHVALP